MNVSVRSGLDGMNVSTALKAWLDGMSTSRVLSARWDVKESVGVVVHRACYTREPLLGSSMVVVETCQGAHMR